MSLADKLAKVQNKPKPKSAEETKLNKDVDRIVQSSLPPPPNPLKSKRQQRATSKSPKRTAAPEPENIADRIRRKKMISRLNALHRLFPAELADLQNMNFHGMSAEQLQELIDSCEFALEDDIQTQFIPSMLMKCISNIDSSAMVVAKMFPKTPFAKHAHLLQGVGEVARQDPGVIRDVKLISTRFVGTVPTNPFMRLIGSLFFIAYQCIQSNKLNGLMQEEKMEKGEYQDL